MANQIKLIPPSWIETSEPVFGDVRDNEGKVIQEGVANRPGKHVFSMLDSTIDVTLGSRITNITYIDATDSVSKGSNTVTMLINSVYVLKLNGTFVLHLPVSGVTIGDTVRIRQGTGNLNDINNVKVVGRSGGKGFPVKTQDSMSLKAAVDIQFDYSYVFTGNAWGVQSNTSNDSTQGEKEIGEIKPGESTDDKYVPIYKPGGEPEIIYYPLKDIIKLVINGLPEASESEKGLVQFSTIAENRAGTNKTKVINPYGLRTELKAYNFDFFPNKVFGKIPFIMKNPQESAFYEEDYIVNNTFYICSTAADRTKMVTANKLEIFDYNDKYMYKYTGGAWVKQGDTVETKIPFGRIYVNTVTKRSYFVRDKSTIIEISSSTDVNELYTDLDKRYVPVTRKVQGKPLTTDVSFVAGDFDAFNKAETRNEIKKYVNNTSGTDLSAGMGKWQGGKYYNFNGSGWVQIWPPVWG